MIDFHNLKRYNQHLILDLKELNSAHIKYHKKDSCYKLFFKCIVGKNGDSFDMWVEKCNVSLDRINELIRGGVLHPIKDRNNPNRVHKYVLHYKYKDHL